MIYQHIRQSTAIINYGGTRFLVDPMLSKKGTLPSFEPAKNGSIQKNPTVDLPIGIEEIIQSIDAVILTHLHVDHWDSTAANVINKEIPIFVQNEIDQTIILKQGFSNVTVLTTNTIFNNISLIKTKGNHGRNPQILEMAGEVCGVVFMHAKEKTLYLAGDTVWYSEVKKTLTEYRPEIIVINAGGNAFSEGGSLVMELEDVQMVANQMPESALIAVHMEATNHNYISREELRQFSNELQFKQQLTIPIDGEILTF